MRTTKNQRKDTFARARTFLVLLVAVMLTPWPPAVPTADALGGPDADGYMWRQTYDVGGPTYKWYGLTAAATTIFTCDECVSAIDPPFPVDFYGESFSSMFVSSNGWIGFVTPQDAGCCVGKKFPNPAAPNGIVAGYWTDLDPRFGTIRAETFGTSPTRTFVVEYDNMAKSDRTAVTMQFHFFEEQQRIEVHYEFAATDRYATAGIENRAGDTGLTYKSEFEGRHWFAVRYAREAPDKPACMDGIDNDRDGRVDHPADPGCASPLDNDEWDPSPSACSDLQDNDGDLLVDGSDPGCSGPGDNDETDPTAPQVASATVPVIRSVTPAFTLAGGTVHLSFDADVTSHFCAQPKACPTVSEWRAAAGSTAQDGAHGTIEGISTTNGYWAQPAWGETSRVRGEGLVHVSGAPGSTGYAKAAARALAFDPSSPWMVTSVAVDIVDEHDGDGDGIPDQLEAQMCGREPFRDVVAALGGAGGACPEPFDDYIPPTHVVRLDVPTSVVEGEDGDQDGFAPWIEVHYTSITLDSRNPANTTVAYGGSTRHVVDARDNDPDHPVVTNVCLGLPVPTGIAVPDDGPDGDGVPAYVRITQGSVCLDRRYPGEPTIHPAADLEQFVLDEDDSDPNVPLASIVSVHDVPVGVSYSRGPGDRDGIPGYVFLTTMNVSFDRRDASLTTTTWTSATKLDPDDNDRDVPIPYSIVDADGDLIPDASESWICYAAENDVWDEDGHCPSAGNYVARGEWQLVLDLIFGGL